jgi:tRNA wybutosine-synthesizing protein 1
MLQRLSEENALPTQIYLSTNASNRNMFFKINGPKYKDAWERWLKSLKFLSKVGTRTVLRFTLIRGFNTDLNYLDEFANLVKIGSPHFIELKSYMHVGMSTNRLEQSNMLEMAEVKKFAEGLESKLKNYDYIDESIPSRIVLLQNRDRSVERWIEKYRS